MNLIEKAIKTISPNWSANRQAARNKLAAYENASNFQARYQSANQGRLNQSWHRGSSDPNITATVAAVDARKIRQRARSAYENNLIAQAIVERMVGEVVQQGFNFRSLSKNPTFKANAENHMWKWLQTANVTGNNWHETQKNIFRYLLIDGDVLIVLRNGGIQIVEAARIGGDLSISEFNNNKVYDGVEVNKDGKPVAFHVDNAAGSETPSTRILAKDAIYLANRKLPNEIRGISIYAQCFELLEWLTEYTESTVVAAKMAACFAVAIITPQPTGFPNTSQTSDKSNGVYEAQTELQSGMITMLPPGGDIKTISASQPTSTYEQFVTSLLRQITASCGITIESLGNIGQTSFSASRMSVEIARETYRGWQHFLINGYLNRMYTWQIAKASKDGELGKDIPADSWLHEWQAPGFRYYDPQTDVQANAMAIETGQTTLTKVLAGQGVWLDEHLLEQKTEKELKAQYGIVNANSQMTNIKVVDNAG